MLPWTCSMRRTTPSAMASETTRKGPPDAFKHAYPSGRPLQLCPGGRPLRAAAQPSPSGSPLHAPSRRPPASCRRQTVAQRPPAPCCVAAAARFVPLPSGPPLHAVSRRPPASCCPSCRPLHAVSRWPPVPCHRADVGRSQRLAAQHRCTYSLGSRKQSGWIGALSAEPA